MSTIYVGDGWFSKVTTDRVNAQEICKKQGYDGRMVEYGANFGVQCRYPGPIERPHTYGSPNKRGGSLKRFGFEVSWKCEKN